MSSRLFEGYACKARELNWITSSLLLLASFVPLFSFFGNKESLSYWPPLFTQADVWASFLISVPLAVILLVIITGSRVTRTGTGISQNALFVLSTMAIALLAILEDRFLPLAIAPSVLISLYYGHRAGLLMSGAIATLFVLRAYLVDSLRLTDEHFAFVVITVALAYVAGRMTELNTELLGKLNRERTRLTELFASLPLGICLTSDKGEILYHNSRIRKPALDLCTDMAKSCDNGAETTRSSDSAQEMEHEGRSYRVTRSTCMVDDSRKQVWMVEDISETARLENEIRKASYLASVGEMAAGVAHELRNPLTVISGFVQLLLEKPDTSCLKDARPYLEISHNELKRLSKIISDFLALSKPQETVKTPVNLNALLTEIGEFLENEALRRDVGLQISLDPSVYEVMGDPAGLKQVVLNLVGNAFDAVDPGGKVSIRTNTGPGTVSLVVEDNGVGISKAFSDKVFVPFFSTKDQGTGIGLAISRRIIFDHNGTLTFRSSPGETQFIVTLPTVRKT